jgi:hypothetical protein
MLQDYDYDDDDFRYLRLSNGTDMRPPCNPSLKGAAREAALPPNKAIELGFLEGELPHEPVFSISPPLTEALPANAVNVCLSETAMLNSNMFSYSYVS